MTESACSGYVHIPTLTLIGSRSEASNWSAWSAEPDAEPVDDRSELRDLVGRHDDQELVGSVATARHGRRQIGGDHLRDGQQGAVPGVVAVGLVEQPEAVDVDQRDPDRAPVAPRLLDDPGELADEGAVVQQPGQRVAPRRVDQGDRLAADPALRRPEDERQCDGRHDRGSQRGDHDRLPQPVELGEDRHRVTPDPDDGLDPAVGLEREVLAQHARRRQRTARLPR